MPVGRLKRESEAPVAGPVEANDRPVEAARAVQPSMGLLPEGSLAMQMFGTLKEAADSTKKAATELAKKAGIDVDAEEADGSILGLCSSSGRPRPFGWLCGASFFGAPGTYLLSPEDVSMPSSTACSVVVRMMMRTMKTPQTGPQIAHAADP